MEKPNWETKQNIKKFQNKTHVAQEVLNQKTHETRNDKQNAERYQSVEQVTGREKTSFGDQTN